MEKNKRQTNKVLTSREHVGFQHVNTCKSHQDSEFCALATSSVL
jgi:hypothetical protein